MQHLSKLLNILFYNSIWILFINKNASIKYSYEDFFVHDSKDQNRKLIPWLCYIGCIP